MSTAQAKAEEVVRELATEIRILEGSAATLQSRLEMVRAAMNDASSAQATLEGLTKMQDGDDTLIPVGAGSYVRMKLADSKKLVMGLGAGTAIERDVGASIEELRRRVVELDRAKKSIQQQLDQTLARYEQDRQSLNQLLQVQAAAQRAAG